MSSAVYTAGPLVTIAVAALNSAAHIAQALGSIRRAAGEVPFEVVLADGGSGDATLECASATAVKENLPLHILPGPDGGIYDGMNRAIAAARGRFILLLNSDDRLAAGALPALVKAAHHDQVMVSGSATITDRQGQTRLIENSRHAMSVESVLFGVPVINARLISTGLLRSLPFDINIGLAADRELLLKILRTGGPRKGITEVVYEYRAHAGSHTIGQDTASRHRIITADEALVASLRANILDDHSARRHIDSFSQALAIKTAVLRYGSRGFDGVMTPPFAEIREILSSPIATVRGLAQTLIWRGNGSGW